jgi:hypothetical protein
MGNTPGGLSSPNGKVVFGFGREPKPLLGETPPTFFLGFIERRTGDSRAR